MKKRIKPAVAKRVPGPGGGEWITSRGVMVEWCEVRNRPRLHHWARYLEMGIVEVDLARPRVEMMEVT